jgi:hypothetical protein
VDGTDSDMNDHKKFEILCALVVVGQVSEADLRELKQHVEGCVDCQDRISDFAQISAQALPLSGKEYGKIQSPRAMTARFMERAGTQGIQLRQSALCPSDLSFGLLSLKGSLAAALVIIAVLTLGISKFVLSRAPSEDTPRAENLGLPKERSTQPEIVQNRSTQQRTKPLPVPRQMTMSSARFPESTHTPRGPNMKGESGSLGPGRVRPEVQYSASHYYGKTGFTSPLLSSDVKNEHPRFFQPYGGSSGRPWVVATSLRLFTERSQPVESADYLGTDPRERTATFAIMSLNSPVHVFSFGSDRSLLSDSIRTQSEFSPTIDWYQVWLRMRTESTRDSNDLSQYDPGVLLHEWPFSKQIEGDR